MRCSSSKLGVRQVSSLKLPLADVAITLPCPRKMQVRPGRRSCAESGCLWHETVSNPLHMLRKPPTSSNPVPLTVIVWPPESGLPHGYTSESVGLRRY
jgi:hypothetical protein